MMTIEQTTAFSLCTLLSLLIGIPFANYVSGNKSWKLSVFCALIVYVPYVVWVLQ